MRKQRMWEKKKSVMDTAFGICLSLFVKYSSSFTQIPGNHRDTKPANQLTWELEAWLLIGHACPLSLLVYQHVLHCVVWLRLGQLCASALHHKQPLNGREGERE